MSYLIVMDTHLSLPPELWEQTPPAVQAYIRMLEERVAILESMVEPLQETVATLQETVRTLQHDRSG
jgi:prefoldin subunit 5